MNVPWNRKPTGDPEIDALEEHVYAKLHDNGYAMFDLKKTPHEDPVFINACERLLVGLADFKWIMVVSNSKKLLQELSSVFPVIYALNNLGKSAITINGDEFADILMGKENERGLEDKAVVKTSLIYLHDFLRKGKLITTLETGVDSFLSEVINRKFILDMSCGESDRDKALTAVFKKIELVSGKEVATCLRSECAAMHVYVEPANHLIRVL